MSTENTNHSKNFFSRLLYLQGDTPSSSFCREIGISTPLYQKWKKGSIPGYDKLRLVSRRYGCSTEWLLGIETFGDRVRMLRESMGWTMADLTKKFNELTGLGADEAYVVGYENDKWKPDAGKVQIFARIFGVKPEQLTGEIPMPKIRESFALHPLPESSAAHCSNCGQLRKIIETQARTIESQARAIESLTPKKGGRNG